jgi:hypothetical protein
MMNCKLFNRLIVCRLLSIVYCLLFRLSLLLIFAIAINLCTFVTL